ncbi:uncharacterized protein LOC129916902 [Episyrphus balteatus]|uniref:uncharacterized protein LOC129906366 n=1 Tax=Episyrphus balteatus TaxID=286459 RepID=UPI002485A983|nr:uncharacterized protein LOC129906366 [Episyrphus balteatus]XP_055853088.1 uncharacterized protein LOC129916902 [Episyrphus balteatus]
MEVPQFNYLLNLVEPHLTKFSNRLGLPVALRLFVTLRFLSTGDSNSSLAYAYRIGKSTVQAIIPEVCEVLWTVLKPIYLPIKTQSGWLQDAHDFHQTWNFPHCLGAVDGKHISIQAPRKSGSLYFNYKKHYSMVLLAVADANYKFTYVDIGAFGSQSDSGIFTNSTFGMLLERDQMNFPSSSPLPGETLNLPYFMVGDEAFPLKNYLITPFSGRYLEDSKSYFNKRLSRARRVVENAFGILASRWRIYQRTIIAEPNTVEKIIKATVVLHNMLCESSKNKYAPSAFVDRQHERDGIWIDGTWRANVGSSQLNRIPATLRLGPRNSTETALNYREYLKEWIHNN